MKILADENIPLSESFFAAHGPITRLAGRTMSAADVRDADVLLVRSVTPVDESLLAASAVKFVGTCTIGTDHLDKTWLDSAGIRYSNAPGCNANSVVEYVYAALATLNVDWRTKTVGIIGCGNVGGALHKALRAQGVKCRCYDPFLTREQNPDLCELDEVLQCDIVSMHTPLTTTGEHPSYHLMGKAQLQKLRPQAVLLNCGRGAVIDNKALLQLLNERDDLHVVLDVWEDEPSISLALLHRVALGTPHIAGYSFDGKLKGTAMIYQAFCDCFNLSPSKTLKQVLPAVKESALALDNARDDWHKLQTLLPKVYDIRADDRRLRALAQAVEQEGANLGQGFDALRKNYPVRREFTNYNILPQANTSGGVSETRLSETLKALGFSLVG